MKIILLISCLFIFSCENLQSQSGNAQSLEIGNKWIYFHDAGLGNNYYTYKDVIGDTVLNGINYAIVKSNQSFGYQRADSNIVYYYNPQDSTENISLNYNWNIGDTLDPDPGHLSIVIDKTTINLWGKILREICVRTTTYYFYPQIKWYTEWIGLTSGDGHIPGGYYTVTLLAAKIENNIYGDTTLLDIDYEEIETLSDFKVYQNYPNPFNPNTIIDFEIPTGGVVIVNFYNILGQLIELRRYNFAFGGKYEINFDGTNYSNGTYIYQIVFNDKVRSNKMLLLK